MGGIVKVTGSGLSLGKNPLTDSGGLAELEGATIRDSGIIEPLPGLSSRGDSGSSSLVRQMSSHEDEVHGEHLVWADAAGNLKLAAVDDLATQKSIANVVPINDSYNQVAIAQVNEHTTLATSSRKTVAVRPAATIAASVMQEAGLPELTTCQASLEGTATGWLGVDKAAVYRAVLERTYGDGHILESAPSGRAIVRNVIRLPAGSMTRSGTTITITTSAPHGVRASVPVVLEAENGERDQDDDIPPGAYAGVVVVSEYVLAVTAPYGSVSTTNTRPYRLYIGTSRSHTFAVAGAQISKAGGVLSITLPRNHGLTTGSAGLASWSVRLFQGTGMTADAGFPAGVYQLASAPGTTTITCSGFASGTATSTQPYYVAFYPPEESLTDAMNPQSNALARQVMVDVPLPGHGNHVELLRATSASGIDTDAAWSRIGLDSINGVVVSTLAYPGRGTISAALLRDRNATGDHKLYQGSITYAARETTVSAAFAQGATTRRVGFVVNRDGTYYQALFDIVDGVVITTSSNVASARVVAEGGPWFRCSMTFTPSAGSGDVAFFLCPDAATGLWSENAWNYTGTASRTVYLDRPRVFDSISQRTNYLKYSQSLATAPWTGDLTMGVASTATETVPVLGSATVTRLSPLTIASGTYVLYQTVNLGGVVTFSGYVRGSASVPRIGVSVSQNAANLDLVTGAVAISGTGTSASLVDVGGGWWHWSLTAPDGYDARIYQLEAGTTSANPGSWSISPALTDYYDVAGLQLELGVGASSYKATTTVPVSAALTYDGQTVPGCEVGDTVSIYRSQASDDPDGVVEPADDCYGVNSRLLTADDMAEGRVRFLEKTSSDRLLTSPLYTNPTDGAVENAPNAKPPVGYDVCEWDARAWLGNVIPRPRLAITILGTTGTGFVVGDQFVIRRSDTNEVRVFPAVAPGTTTPGAFAVHTLGTVSQNVELTARDLVRAINACEPCSIKAYYVGADFTTVGQIVLETKDIGGPQDSPGFTFDVLDSAGKRKIGPVTNPAPGSSSDNEHIHNGVQFSKQNEHEAWPILNTVRFGARQDFVRKMFGFRDRLYVFSRYGGVFVVVGPYPYRVLGPISSAKLLGSRCVTEFADNVWCLTDQGLGYITDSGFVVASADVDRAWRDLLGPEGQAEVVSENAFLVGDDANGLLYVWVPSAPFSGSVAAAAKCFVYNVRTRTWSTWTRTAEAACVSQTTGDVWVAAKSSISGPNTQLATIRRSGTATDYADMTTGAYTLTLAGGSYYASVPLPAGTRLTRSGVDYWLVEDALTYVAPHGYGPLVVSRTAAFAPAGTDAWTFTLPVPASIQWHPIDAGDFGVRKLFSQLQLAWSEETDLAESLVAVAPDDGDFSADLVLPATTRRLQRVEPLPRSAADTNALKVRVRIQQAQKAWRLLGLRLEVAGGGPGKGAR